MIMIKLLSAFSVGCAATLATVLLLNRPVPAPPLEETRSLQGAYGQLVQSLADAGDFVAGHRWYGSEREQAEAYRHIMRILISSL